MTDTVPDTLNIIPLGGMGEIGKNMTAYEYGGKIVVVDCGLAFPRDEMLGIDLVLPDITFLREHKDDVLAFVITHGHEDHFGALPYVLREISAPVYASRLTLAFAKSKLDEHGLLRSVEAVEVTEDSVLDLDPFTVRFCAVTHSVPDALAIVIETPVGRVVHSGDYKFDHTPIDGRTTDVNKLAQLGQEGVLALLSDSTNIESEGSTGSESQVGQAFHRIFAEAEGRVLMACFSSHIHRIQQAVQIASLHGRKFAVSGRSMVKNVNIAQNGTSSLQSAINDVQSSLSAVSKSAKSEFKPQVDALRSSLDSLKTSVQNVSANGLASVEQAARSVESSATALENSAKSKQCS